MKFVNEICFMIAHIKGCLQDIIDSTVIVDVGGVGFSVLVSQRTIQSFNVQSNNIGQEVFLHTHFQLKEDGVSLYGFQTQLERQIFQFIIGVTGVGPKVAMSLLSAFSPAELVNIFLEKDLSSLEHVSGVGKKTAQRLVMELSDKVAKISNNSHFQGKYGKDFAKSREDIYSALELLMELGANRKEAMDALEKVKQVEGENHLPVDELITKSLTYLGAKK